MCLHLLILQIIFKIYNIYIYNIYIYNNNTILYSLYFFAKIISRYDVPVRLVQGLRARSVQDDLVFILIFTAGSIKNDAILAGVYVPIAVLFRPDFLDYIRRRVRKNDVPQHIICNCAEPGHGDAGAERRSERTKMRVFLSQRNVTQPCVTHRVTKK